MRHKPYQDNIRFCESCLEAYGDNPRGVGWLRGDGDTRHRVMLGLIRPSLQPVTLLDFGCGTSHLNEYLIHHGPAGVVYSGLDLSARFLGISRRKFPHVTYYSVDVLDPQSPSVPTFDYVVMNGLFTYKGGVEHDEMFAYLRSLVRRVFESCRIGIAFNVMSKQVEWEQDDLFHAPMDTLLAFLSREVSRHVVIRHDYGLYEYTAYVYQTPTAPDQQHAKKVLSGSPPEDT